MLGRIFRNKEAMRRAARGFVPKANLLGRAHAKEATKFWKEGGLGFDKMVFDKLRFFHLCGNVFLAYCALKFTTSVLWADWHNQ